MISAGGSQLRHDHRCGVMISAGGSQLRHDHRRGVVISAAVGVHHRRQPPAKTPT
jgi:hypothetical protein